MKRPEQAGGSLGPHLAGLPLRVARATPGGLLRGLRGCVRGALAGLFESALEDKILGTVADMAAADFWLAE